MPDVFANITAAPPQALEMISNVLELRASISQQQEMLRTYLGDIAFPDRAKVLEIGCGTGPIARVLAAWPSVGEVVGVDPSPYLIDKARTLSSGASNLVLEVGDGKALRFKDASFDVVILHTVLTHVPAPEAVLAGTGLSDRTSEIFTLEQRMDDVRAVMDAVPSERAAVFGVSEGGPMSLLFAATYPQRTSALVIYGSYARRVLAPDHPFGPTDAQWAASLARMEREWGGPVRLDTLAPSVTNDPVTEIGGPRISSSEEAPAPPSL